jgi:rhamnosyltransferase
MLVKNIKSMKICSLITIYKPDIVKLEQNIQIILEYSDVIYLLFNSCVIDEFQYDTRIISIDNKKNIGLSKAINRGIKQAAEDGYQYAILFDQDSYITNENFIKLFAEMQQEEKHQKVMCIGPSLNIRNNIIAIPNWSKNRRKTKSNCICSVNNIITSGMLVNTHNFLQIRGFNENFPVDFCDFLFCWKAIYNGYAILQSMDAYIIHEIGTNYMKVCVHTIHFHAPYRNYFLVRDTLNICLREKETPLMIRFRYLFFLPIRMTLFLILLDKKLARLKMYWCGLKDFFMAKPGFGSIAGILDAE